MSLQKPAPALRASLGELFRIQQLCKKTLKTPFQIYQPQTDIQKYLLAHISSALAMGRGGGGLFGCIGAVSA